MAPILSSEIARLVLGYLEESKCEQSYKSFLESNNDLKECLYLYRSGKQVPTEFMGKTLIDILEEYVNIHSLVQHHIKKLKSDEQKDRCLPAVLPITASLFDQIRVLIDASSTSQTMLLSITLPANSNNSHSNKTKVRSGSKSERNPNKHKHSALLGELEDRNKKGHSPDKCGLSVDDSDVDVTTPIKHKTSVGLFRSSSKDDDEINESVRVEMIAKAILDKPELQEKIAENINLIRNTPNEIAPVPTSVPTSKVTEEISDYGILNPANILDNELDIIKTIVEKTERDPVFEKFLDEIVGPVAEITSDENVHNSCSMTSTPQRSRSIPRAQLNNRRRFFNVRSLPDVRKINRNKIPLRDRLRNVKQKNLDNILTKSDDKQMNLKSIDDHNAAAIQSIINAGSHKTNVHIPVLEDECENQINPPHVAVTEQDMLPQVFDSHQDIQKVSEKSKFSVTTNIENVLEVQNKVFEEKTTNSTLNSLINDIFTPTQQAAPSTTSNNGDVVLFEGSLDKYLQSSHILPPSYSTQSTTIAPQKQISSTGMILQQPTSLLVQQPTGGYFMLNHNIVSTQHPLLISQDPAAASSVNAEITSPFYIVQNTSMLNYPSSNVLNFTVQQPKIEISVPKPQSLTKPQSEIVTKSQEMKTSSITPQEIMEMPMIMCTEQETVADQEKTLEKPQDLPLLNEKADKSLNIETTQKNKNVNFKRKLSRKTFRKFSKSFSQKRNLQLNKALNSTNEKSKCKSKTSDITPEKLESFLSKNELNLNVCDTASVKADTSILKKSSNSLDNEVQTADHSIDSNNQSKSQTKRRIVPVLISSQTESINRVFQECREQITLYSTSNVAETVIVDSNKNRLNLSESSEKCNKIKSKTPESLIRNTSSEFFKAQSTPKSGGRSHVRALNFSTPPKSIESVKTSVSKDVQCRMRLFDKDSKALKYLNEFSNKMGGNIPIATRSPMQKLKADWDRVQGVGLIFGMDNNPVVKKNNLEMKSGRKRSFSESDLIISPSKNQVKPNCINEKNDIHKEFSDDQKNSKKSSWDADLRALVTSSPPKKKMKRVIQKKELVDNNSSTELKKSKKGKQNVLNSSDEVEVSPPVTRRITRSCTSPRKNIHASKENSKTVPEIVKKKVTKKVVIKPRSKNKRASPEIDSKSVETNKCDSVKKDLKSVFKIEEMEKLICTVDEEYIRNKNKPRRFRKKCNLSSYTDVSENIAPVVVFDKSQMKIELSTNGTKCVSKEDTENQCATRSLPEILNKELTPTINIVDKSQSSLDKTEHHFEKPQYNPEKSNHNFEMPQHNVKIISDTNITPDLTKQLTSFPITSVHNLIPLFETPVKEDFSGIPITPRFLSPFSTIDTPITKLLKEQSNIMNESVVPTPIFPPMTPNVILTPKLPDSGSPSGYFNRGTDYSTCSSSYYQPSESDQNALEHMIITECAKYERNETRELNKSGEVTEASSVKEVINNNDVKTSREINKEICDVKETGNVKEMSKKPDSVDMKNSDKVKESNDEIKSTSAKKKSETESTNAIKDVHENKKVIDNEQRHNNVDICEIKKTGVNDISNIKEINSSEGMSDVKRTSNNKGTKDIKKSSNVKSVGKIKEAVRAKEMNKTKGKQRVEEVSNVKETSNIEKSVCIKQLNNDNESLVKETNDTEDVNKANKINENVDKETEVIPYTLLEISLPERKFSKVLDKTKYESTSHFEDDNARDTDGNESEIGSCVLKISGNLLKELTPVVNDSTEINSEANVSNKSKKSFSDDTSDSSSTSSSSSSASCSSDSSTTISDSSFSLTEGNDTVIQRTKSCTEETNVSRYSLRDRINSKQTKENPNEVIKCDNVSIEDNKFKNVDSSSQNKGLTTVHKNSPKLSSEHEVNDKQENKNSKVEEEIPQNITSSLNSMNVQASSRDIEADQKLYNELKEKRQRIIEKLQAFTTSGKEKKKMEKRVPKKVEKCKQTRKFVPRNRQGKFSPVKINKQKKIESKITPACQVLPESTWEIVNNEDDSLSKNRECTVTGLKFPQVLPDSKVEKEVLYDSKDTSSAKVKHVPVVKKIIRNNKSVSNETQQESDSESTIALVTHLKERGILLVPNKKKTTKTRSTLAKTKDEFEQLNKTETIRIKTKKPLKSLHSSHESNKNENIKKLDVKYIKKSEMASSCKHTSENEKTEDSNENTNTLNGCDIVGSKLKSNSRRRSKNEIMSKFQKDSFSNKDKVKNDDGMGHKQKVDEMENESKIDNENLKKKSNKTLDTDIKLSTCSYQLNKNKLDNSNNGTSDTFQKSSLKDKKIVEPVKTNIPKKVTNWYDNLSCCDTSDYISIVRDESQIKSKKVNTNSTTDLSVFVIELDLFNREFVRVSASPLIHLFTTIPKRDNRVKPIKIIRRRHILKKSDESLKTIEKIKDNYHIDLPTKIRSIQESSEQISSLQNVELSEKQKVVESVLEKVPSFEIHSLVTDSQVTLENKVKKQSPLDILCAELSDDTNDTSFDSFVNEPISVPLSSASVYPESVQDSDMNCSPKDRRDEIKLKECTDIRCYESKSFFELEKSYEGRAVGNCNKETFDKCYKSKYSFQKYDKEKRSKSKSPSSSHAAKIKLDKKQTDVELIGKSPSSSHTAKIKLDKKQTDVELIGKSPSSKIGDIVSKLNESLEEGECSGDDDDALMTYALVGEDAVNLTSKPMPLKKRKLSENQEMNVIKRSKPNDPQSLLKKLDLDSFLRQVHGPDE